MNYTHPLCTHNANLSKFFYHIVHILQKHASSVQSKSRHSLYKTTSGLAIYLIWAKFAQQTANLGEMVFSRLPPLTICGRLYMFIDSTM